jgi:hypothetical protein
MAAKRWAGTLLLVVSFIGNLAGQQVVDTSEANASVHIFGAIADSRFGQSLAAGDLNGDGNTDLVVGAPGRRPDQRPGPGSVHIFWGPLTSGVWNLAERSADVVIAGADTVGGLGTSLATGDVNGDGIDDLVVGAPEKAGQFREQSGTVYVFFGRRDWPAFWNLSETRADVEFWGADFFEKLGARVAVGNVDGQAPADLIFSAPSASGRAGAASGRTYVVLGGAELQGRFDLKVTPADLTISGRQSQGFFGWALAAGDINDDGFDDVVIGAYKVNVGLAVDAGEVYVVFGERELPDSLDLAISEPNVRLLGPDKRDHFGFAVTCADLNGDGISDLVVGARQAEGSSGLSEPGAVFAFWGRPQLPDTVDLAQEPADFVARGAEESGQFGYSLAVGDVNQDDTADLLVGAPLADVEGRSNAGQALLLNRPDGGGWDLSTRPASVTYLGPANAAALATAVLIADLNSDGTGDLVLGAPTAAGGEVWMYYGDRTLSVSEKSPQGHPKTFHLSSGYPNPFNQQTLIRFEVQQPQRVTELVVFNRLGARVRTLPIRAHGLRQYEAEWDGTDEAGRRVAAGIYLIRLRVGSSFATTKVVLVR